jgi:hypothetical protein
MNVLLESSGVFGGVLKLLTTVLDI